MENENDIEVLANKIVHFIAVDLSERFPKIHGAGIGLPLDAVYEINSLPEDQQRAKVEELLGFQIYVEEELTQEERKEVLRLISEKFFNFKVVGRPVLY